MKLTHIMLNEKRDSQRVSYVEVRLRECCYGLFPNLVDHSVNAHLIIIHYVVHFNVFFCKKLYFTCF